MKSFTRCCRTGFWLESLHQGFVFRYSCVPDGNWPALFPCLIIVGLGCLLGAGINAQMLFEPRTLSVCKVRPICLGSSTSVREVAPRKSFIWIFSSICFWTSKNEMLGIIWNASWQGFMLNKNLFEEWTAIQSSQKILICSFFSSKNEMLGIVWNAFS